MGFERGFRQDLASRLFPRGSAQAFELCRAAWPHAVGAELARRTELLSLEGATLRVRVPDAGWRKVLNRMQRDILSRLRAIAGEAAPSRLGFTEGGLGALPPVVGASVPGAAPAPAPSDALRDSAAAIPDAELREDFLRTAARYLERSTPHA